MRIFLAAMALVAGSCLADEGALRIGSKRFTESYVLGEIAAQAARASGAPAVHVPGLGNTAILVAALSAGSIDAYPEYTGTIAREILKTDERLDLAGLDARLAPLGLSASVPLGFADGYAIGLRRAYAEEHGIRTLSDLAKHPEVRLGLSHEFLARRDGWPGLKAAYSLPQADPQGLDHGLAYDALAAAQVDAIDLYTTDAKIERDGIVVLRDNRGYFPRYDAVFLHRADVASRHPRAWVAVRALEGRIDAGAMIRMNARAEIDRQSFAAVAAQFLGKSTAEAPRGFLAAIFAPDFARLLGQHAALVFISLALAVAVGVPMGVVASRIRAVAQPVLLAAGLVQTVPALALLAFLIPATGAIGAKPAMIALFLYALLPIVRNTHAGLAGVPAGLREAAIALGLSARDRLLYVELPIALPVIIAGVRTAAVISVGTATIAAFIGAGGFGERISEGLALNDGTLLLAGAIPAAALALVVEGGFALLERMTRRP